MGPSIEKIRQLLAYRGRDDLDRLLARALSDYEESTTYGSRLFSMLTTAVIRAPVQDYERLRELPEEDKKLVLQVITELHPPRDHGMEINSLEFILDPDKPIGDISDVDVLIGEIEAQRNLMIAVATGGPRINTVNHEYKERRTRIEEGLARRGIADPDPHSDLWDWYGKWSSGDLPSYQSRREYVSGLYEPLLRRLRAGVPEPQVVFYEPTGWVKVDRQLGELRRRLEEADAEEQYQAVGLVGRECLITLAQMVFDSERHWGDEELPSSTDAKRMLQGYLQIELQGSSHEIARRHAKAALDLANDLQHRRTATFRAAALCAEATASVVNLIAIISGQRDPE